MEKLDEKKLNDYLEAYNAGLDGDFKISFEDAECLNTLRETMNDLAPWTFKFIDYLDDIEERMEYGELDYDPSTRLPGSKRFFDDVLARLSLPEDVEKHVRRNCVFVNPAKMLITREEQEMVAKNNDMLVVNPDTIDTDNAKRFLGLHIALSYLNYGYRNGSRAYHEIYKEFAEARKLALTWFPESSEETPEIE